MDGTEYIVYSDEEGLAASPSSPSSPRGDGRRKVFSGLGKKLATIASSVGGAIARSAEAAAEVLGDAELRSRAAKGIQHGLQTGARSIQSGLASGATSIQRGLQTVQRGPRNLQAILVRVQQQIEQQRMAALLEEQRDAPVDVQVGGQCYEDSPQELRSRLWMALLEHPELVSEYQALLASLAQQQRESGPPGIPPPGFSLETPPHATASTPPADAAGPEDIYPLEAAAADLQLEPGGSSGAEPHAAAAPEAPADEGEGAGEEPAGEAGAEPEQDCPSAVAATAGEQQSAGEAAAPAPVHPLAVERSAESGGSERAQPQPPLTAAGTGNGTPSLQDQGHLSLDPGHLSPTTSRCSSRATSPAGRLATPAIGNSSFSGRRQASRRDSSHAHVANSNGTPTSARSSLAGAGLWPGASGEEPSSPGDGSGSGEWEVVEEGKQRQGQALLAGASSGNLAGSYSREQEAFRNKLMEAMMAVPWPLPTDYPEECRYATLLQISVGQEEVDEVISRDIHRTFPEHPLFGFEQGQQALFRVLKAYSLHDIEVGYCQGMAFVAGLLLFYMNEEPAFQMFCRLLGASGPNLRRLYLPGLEGLKAELRRFEFLMARYLPNLKAHLEACGVVPVLFASQWFLTAFSCPFPVQFACRVLDVMAVEGTDSIMLRTALTIMAECEADLFMLDDFEEIITYLKVEPVQWPLHRVRRVLNAAVHSAITPEDLAAAAAAVDEGYSGSLSRNTSSVETEAPSGRFFPPGEGPGAAPSAAEGPATATAAERALSLRHHSRGPSLGGAAGRQASLGAGAEAAAAAAAAVQGGELGGAAGAAGPGAVGGRGGGDALEAELEKQKAALDEDYLAMVMELDMLWGNSEEVGPAAAEAALGPAAPGQQQ